MTEPDVYKNTETLDHSYIAGRNIKWNSESRKQLDSFLKSKNISTMLSSYSTSRYVHKRKEGTDSYRDLYVKVHTTALVRIVQNKKQVQMSINK